jgi:hypothetical protein
MLKDLIFFTIKLNCDFILVPIVDGLGLEEKHKPKIILEAAPEASVEGGKKKKKPRAQNNCLFCKNPGRIKVFCIRRLGNSVVEHKTLDDITLYA